MSRFTVVAVDESTVTLRPWGPRKRGGEPISFTSESILVTDGPDGSYLQPADLAVGDVLELEIDESTGIGSRELRGAKRCLLKQGGQGWKVPGPGRDSLRSSDFGIETSQEVAWLQKEYFWIVEDGGQPSGHFEDADARIAARQAEQRDELAHRAKTKARRESQKRRDYRPDRFHNPYNFVPFPSDPPARQAPPGHHRQIPDLLSGRINYTYEAKTPLLVSDGKREDGPPRRGPSNGYAVPGSALKGAIRSLHETITGSCYQVVDLDYVPGYRDALSAGNKAGWNLAIVRDSSNGRPTKIEMCDQTVWVPLSCLKAALGNSGVRTGARLRVDGEPSKGPGDRLEFRDCDEPSGSKVTADPRGDWILLVTDVRARSPKDRKTGAKKGVFYAIGRLSGDDSAELSDSGWAGFQAAVDGADDMRTRRRTGSEGAITEEPVRAWVWEDGRSSQTTVKTYRQKVTDRLEKGHVIWAKLGAAEDHPGPSDTGPDKVVTQIALAQTWRHPGSTPVRDRLPEHLHQCQNPRFLCPSCQIFGTAPSGKQGRPGSRTDTGPYRAQVRFTDASFTTGFEPELVELAPLLGPKPSAGHFYLEDDGTRKQLPPDGQPALREWGSPLDRPSPRMIRGRKFYWHTTPRKNDPRYKMHDQQGKDNAGNTSGKASLIPNGSAFSGSIIFENLREDQLGSLLATLDPARLLEGDEPQEFAIHIGGGRPVGLGSVQVKSLSVSLEPRPSDRYAGQPSRQASDTETETWVAKFKELASDSVKQTWSSLGALLTFDYVNPDTVRYPSVKDWPSDAGQRANWEGKHSLDWWKVTGGPSKGTPGARNATYLRLPPATAPDPSLPTDPTEEDQ